MPTLPNGKLGSTASYDPTFCKEATAAKNASDLHPGQLRLRQKCFRALDPEHCSNIGGFFRSQYLHSCTHKVPEVRADAAFNDDAVHTRNPSGTLGKARPPVSLTQALPLSMTAAAHSCLVMKCTRQNLVCSTYGVYGFVTSLC